MTTKELTVKKNTMREFLESPDMRKRIKQAIPEHLDEGQFIRVILGVILPNPKLVQCTPESLLTSIMAVAQLGLSPIPFLGQAYIVPFGTDATFIPGYRGYILLGRRGGDVNSVEADVVYTNDHFEMVRGLERKLEHIPADTNRGEPKGAYVVVRYREGEPTFDYMPVQDIEKIRLTHSKQPNGMAWKDSWDEMAKKTVIKRHFKLVPMGVEIQKAAALEDKAYVGESQFDIVFPEDTEEKLPESGPTEDFDTLVNNKLENYPPEERAKLKGLIGKSLEQSADYAKISIDDCKAKAATVFETDFWPSFMNWVAKQKPEDPDDLIIARIEGFRTPGLTKWEEQNRSGLHTMSPKIKHAFTERWEKRMGRAYNFAVPETTEPSGQPEEKVSPEGTPGGSEQESGEAPMVVCPNTGEQYAREYCIKQGERTGCYADCPAWEQPEPGSEG